GWPVTGGGAGASGVLPAPGFDANSITPPRIRPDPSVASACSKKVAGLAARLRMNRGATGLPWRGGRTMTDQQTSEKSIFLAALEQESPEERAAYLDRTCGGDDRLRGAVEEMLAAHPRLGTSRP